MPSFRVLLDACVLYPSLLRDVLLTIAEAEFYQPCWTEDILEEVRRNIVKDGRMTGEKAARLVQVMNEAFPDANIEKSK
jgi:hypothetical protein